MNLINQPIRLNEFNYKKGFGLVEVLIALLIISATMIVAIGTVARGLKISKDNEIRDIAVSTVLRGLDFGNGFNQIPLPPEVANAISTNTLSSICYRFDGDLDNDNNVLNNIYPIGGSTCLPITTCTDEYRVSIEGADICHQLIFTSRNQNDLQMVGKMRIVSSVIYLIDGQEYKEVMETYRDY